MRVGVVAQGNTSATYALTKRQVFSALEAAQIYGFGSPAHLTALEFLPANGDGIGAIPFIIYPLADGSSASVGDITPTTGPQTTTEEYVVKINEIRSEPIVIPAGTVAADTIPLIIAAVNAINEMPMIASNGTTKVDFTSKWKGASANDLFIEIEGTISGVTFTIRPV